MLFECRGIRNNHRRKEGCEHCRIQTHGSAEPDRCVFSHGPEVIRWDLISEVDQYEFDEVPTDEERLHHTIWVGSR